VLGPHNGISDKWLWSILYDLDANVSGSSASGHEIEREHVHLQQLIAFLNCTQALISAEQPANHHQADTAQTQTYIFITLILSSLIVAHPTSLSGTAHAQGHPAARVIQHRGDTHTHTKKRVKKRNFMKTYRFSVFFVLELLSAP
jgi:hypothetical protein